MGRLLRCVPWLAALVAVWLVGTTGTVAAQETVVGPLRAGTVVGVAGTPHLFVADERGVLHWGGDTRGLEGRAVDWSNRLDLPAGVVASLERGDPWLSAGLVKIGDPIYLAKWETTQERPTLQHIQSIADVELFGINAENYGRFVLERGEWQRRHGFDTDALRKLELPPAAPARVPPGTVILDDTFDDPSVGILAKVSTDPAAAVGYVGGEYFVRRSDPNAGTAVLVPGVYRDASVAVDVRLLPGADVGFATLNCRHGRAADGRINLYRLRLDARGGRFRLLRFDAGTEVSLLDWTTSTAIRRSGTNRVELTCAGTTISVTVNGVAVGAVDDATYRSGAFSLSVGFFTGTVDPVEARFDGLVVTQR